MLIRSSILVAGLGLLGPSMPTAQAQDYGEWRALTSDEEKARIAAVRPGSVAPAVVEADFDGDGTKDKVLIAIRKADGARRVIAVMGNRVNVIEPKGVDAPDGLGLADSGSDDTICGNAFQQLHKEACDDYPAHMNFRYCDGPHAAHVTLKRPGFLWIGGRGFNLQGFLEMRSRVYALYVWDRKKGRFLSPSWISSATKMFLTTGSFCVASRRIDRAIATPVFEDAKPQADLGRSAPRRSGRGFDR